MASLNKIKILLICGTANLLADSLLRRMTDSFFKNEDSQLKGIIAPNSYLKGILALNSCIFWLLRAARECSLWYICKIGFSKGGILASIPSFSNTKKFLKVGSKFRKNHRISDPKGGILLMVGFWLQILRFQILKNS